MGKGAAHRLAELYARTEREILDKGFTKEHTHTEDGDIHCGSKWHTMRAIYEPLLCAMASEGVRVPSIPTSWARALRAGRKAGFACPELCTEQDPENTFKHAYDAVCSAAAAMCLPAGPQRTSPPALASVVGTERHIDTIMKLSTACQAAREASPDARFGTKQSPSPPEVEEEMGTTKAGSEAVRRVHCGIAYVDWAHTGLTRDEVSWHIRMMARSANSRTTRAQVIKNTYKQGAPVRYGTLLDRSVSIIKKAPASTHTYVGERCAGLLQRDFGGAGVCPLPCCFSGMSNLNRPDDHKAYTKEVVASRETSLLLFSHWHRDSVLSGPYGVCLHPQYPVMKVAHCMRGEDIDARSMETFMQANGLARPFVQSGEPGPLEALVGVPRADVESCYRTLMTSIPTGGEGLSVPLQLPETSESPYDKMQATLVCMAGQQGMHVFEASEGGLRYIDSIGLMQSHLAGKPPICVAWHPATGMWASASPAP